MNIEQPHCPALPCPVVWSCGYARVGVDSLPGHSGSQPVPCIMTAPDHLLSYQVLDATTSTSYPLLCPSYSSTSDSLLTMFKFDPLFPLHKFHHHRAIPSQHASLVFTLPDPPLRRVPTRRCKSSTSSSPFLYLLSCRDHEHVHVLAPRPTGLC